MDTLIDCGISLNQPLYVYQQPMFMLTVSVVLIAENGVVLNKKYITNGNTNICECSFPGGIVKASVETIQFAAVRMVKEQLGLRITKESLIPVDFRSSPERSKEGNVVDIGMVCMLEKIPESILNQWEEIDFEKKCLVKKDGKSWYMDHNILLDRAMDIILFMK